GAGVAGALRGARSAGPCQPASRSGASAADRALPGGRRSRGADRARGSRTVTVFPPLWHHLRMVEEPSDAIPDNPMGTNGFAFVVFSAPDPTLLERLFDTLGFATVACHPTRRLSCHRQGAVELFIDAEPGGFADAFA